MIPNINDCSWHRTCSWAGQPFVTVHNGCVKVENMVMTEDRLYSALTSLQDTLFRDDPTGFDVFCEVITQIFKFGMVQISHHITTGGQITVELV